MSFENADIVESELSRVTTQPVLTQTTGITSGLVPGLGNNTANALHMTIKNLFLMPIDLQSIIVIIYFLNDSYVMGKILSFKM